MIRRGAIRLCAFFWLVAALVAPASVVYVKHDATGADDGTSWADAFSELQPGIEAAFAAGGGEVWVAAGTYRPTSDLDYDRSFVLRADVDVYGGFTGHEESRNARDWVENRTVLSGDIGRRGCPDDNSLCVVVGNNNSRLDGFFVTDADRYVYSGKCGGMYNRACAPLVANCTFVGNYDGMKNEESARPRIVNCTFFNNISAIDNGYPNSSPELYGCILWQNRYVSYFGSSAVVRYSCIEGGYEGTGNLSEDPLFADADAQDFSLLPSSPCIDAGHNRGENDVAFFDAPDTPNSGAGSPGFVDMGSHEYWGELYPIVILSQAQEIDGAVTVSVRLAGSGSGSASVEYALIGGTATSGLDYVVATGVLSWPAGDRSVKTFTVDILDDDLNEPDETVMVRLSNPQGARLSTGAAGPLTILDDEFEIVYVDETAVGRRNGRSWQDAFTDLQHAFAAPMLPGDEIWVAAGVYSPSPEGSYNASFELLEGVSVYGGFVGCETVREDRDWSANRTVLSGEGALQRSRTVVTAADASLLDGFTVTGGSDRGLLVTSCSASVRHCRFGEEPGKYSYGHAIYCGSATLAVSDCVFTNHKCRFSVIEASASALTINGCTIAGNWVERGKWGEAVSLGDGSTLAVSNSILWGNTEAVGIDAPAGSCTVVHSCVEGGYEGVGNLDLDPLFVDLDAGCLALSPGSPCIDAADGTLATPYDSEGRPRCDDPDTPNTGDGEYDYADMGSLEYQGFAYIYADDVTVDEAAGQALVVVRVLGGMKSEIRLQYDTVDGSATAGSDYTSTSGVLTWQPGERQDKTVSVPILDDAVLERDEAFTVHIASLDRMGRVRKPTVSVYVHDNEHAVIRVKSDAEGAADGSCWQDAYSDLQDALAVAWSGDEIWVAGGTYFPTLDTSRNASFELPENVALYGGFAGIEQQRRERDWVANRTMLSGDIGECGVSEDNSYRVVVGAEGTILDGFRVMNGNGRFTGGSYLWGGSSMFNRDCSVTVRNCIFQGSVHAAGAFNDSADAVFENCFFLDNTGSNSDGGLVACGSRVSVANCTFSGNDQGLWVESRSGGTSLVTVENCIFWGNVYKSIFRYDAGATVRYSCVEGGYEGEGNIDANPLLHPGVDEFLYLLPGSPCIDAANDEAAPEYDACGLSRFDHPGGLSIADMGATEFQGMPFVVIDEAAHESAEDTGSFQIQIQLVGTFSEPVSVVYSTVASTAEAGTDFEACSGVFTWGAGETGERILTVPVVDDTAKELSETFSVQLSSPVNCILATPRADLTILPDNDWPVVFVKSDATGAGTGKNWQDAFTDLQDALALPLPGPRDIWVAAGTYTPTPKLAPSVSFEMREHVNMYGGFDGSETLREERDWDANVTILSGKHGYMGSQSWLSSHVVIGADHAVLDGFTVTGASNSGMYNHGVSPTVSNCVFSECSATDSGGGMYTELGAPVLTSCVFLSNYAYNYGGGACFVNSSPVLSDCSFSTNRARRCGGAVYNDTSDVTFVACHFIDNITVPSIWDLGRGGAVADYHTSSVYCDCLFRANRSGDYGGALYAEASQPELTNCLIAESAARRGGGMCCLFGTLPELVNCTVALNEAEDAGGGILAGTATLVNCIVWGNTVDGAAPTGSEQIQAQSLTLTRSCVEDGIEGWKAGNTDADPRFVDAGRGDFHLLSDSPCIDAADGNEAPDADAGGNPRYDHPSAPNTGNCTPDFVDIGCFEYRGLPTLTIEDVIVNEADERAEVLVHLRGTTTEPVKVTWITADGTALGTEDFTPASGSITWDAGETGAKAFTVTVVDDALNEIAETVQLWLTDSENARISVAGAVLTITDDEVGILRVKEGAGGSGDGSSWHDAFTDLQAALDSALSGDEVWVAAGVYRPGASRWSSFYLPSSSTRVIIYGGFAGNETSRDERDWTKNETVLDGDIGVTGDAADNCYTVVENISLDGVTVRGGNANGSYSFYQMGGGIQLSQDGLSFRNCTIVGNQAQTGGGVYCSAQSCLFVNCTIAGNADLKKAGIAIAHSSSDVTLTNCIVWGNSEEPPATVPPESGGGSTVVISTQGGRGASSLGEEVTITYSCIAGGHTGEGNIDADPLFEGLHTGNVRLLPGSPCIDAGDARVVAVTEGYARHDAPSAANTGVGSPPVDMGAHEFRDSLPQATVEGVTVNESEGEASVIVTLRGTAIEGASVAWSLAEGTATAGEDYAPQTGILVWGTGETGVRTITISITDDTLNETEEVFTVHLASPQGLQIGKQTAVVQILDDEAGVIYVRADAQGACTGQSWTDAFADLGSALGLARAGDEVWVAAGTYLPPERDSDGSEDRSRSFQLKNGVAVYGGFAGTETTGAERDWVVNTTVLSGDIGLAGDRSDNCYHVVFNSEDAALDSTAGLDGFVITGGNADGSGDAAYGGGIYNDACSPTIANCTFSDNYARYWGGGICGRGTSSLVAKCVFRGNRAGDAGGGLYNGGGAPLIDGCEFYGNKAVEGGGIANYGSSPQIRNCLITGNVAAYGAGIHNYHSSPAVTNVTMTGNRARQEGGGIANIAWSWATVRNCIVWDNPGGEIVELEGNYYGDAEGNTTVRYSCIKGQHWGYTNTYDDPMFLNATSGLLLLQPGSPCIDAGDGNTAPETDAAGHARFDDPETDDAGIGVPSFVDMGWREYQGGPVIVVAPQPFAENTGIATVTVELRGVPIAPVTVHCATIPGGSAVADQDFVPASATLSWAAGTTGNKSLQIEILDNLSNNPDRTIWVTLTGAVNASAPQPLTILTVEDDETVVLHVDGRADGGDGSSWTKALGNLQDALSMALPGDEIWVVAGTYTPTKDANRGRSFVLREGVGLYGGFLGNETARSARDWVANQTILSGDIGLPGSLEDNSLHVIVGTNDAIIDGFHVTGGYASDSGAGMWNEFCSPTIRNCTFHRNFALNGGAGIHNFLATPYITSCEFTYNEVVKVSTWSTSPNGGGMSNVYSDPEIADCLFEANVARYGGAAHNSESSPRFTGCRFIRNQAANYGGAIYNTDSAPSLMSSNFIGNEAVRGDAVYDGGSSTRLTNCVVAGHPGDHPPLYGGTAAIATNCIIWGNTHGHAGSNWEITDSCIQGDYGGVGNIDLDPMLLLSPDGYACLQAGSPCIDAGNGQIAPERDIHDCLRFDDPDSPNRGLGPPDYVDMGSAEFRPTPVIVVTDVRIINQVVVVDVTLNRSASVPITVDYATTDGTATAATDYAPTTGVIAWAPGEQGTKRIEIALIDDGAAEDDETFSVALTNVQGAVLRGDGLTPVTIPGHRILRVRMGLAGGDGSSWGRAHSLTSALENAAPGDEIWVAKGVYERRYATQTAAFVIENGVRVFGGFAGNEMRRDQRNWLDNPVVLSGAGFDTPSHVVVCQGDGTIDGVTIEAGHSDEDGGGIQHLSGSLTVANCTFLDNRAMGEGGAIYVGASASPLIVNCVFSRNTADKRGGAISCYSDDAYILNCTFLGNDSSISGGGLSTWDCAPTVANCIFWDNGAEGVDVGGRRQPSVTYSCLQQLLEGVGNIQTDPLTVVVDFEHGVFSLPSSSPCADAGNDALLPMWLIKDIAGNPRIGGQSVAMGAHEPSGAYIKGTLVYAGKQDGAWIVQAFDTADFTGSPLATGTASLSRFKIFRLGVLPGTHYLRAFRDSDADGSMDAWEPQGVYAGGAVTVPPDAYIKIILTDPDTDGDSVPDWWEIDVYGDLTAPAAASVVNYALDLDGGDGAVAWDRLTGLEENVLPANASAYDAALRGIGFVDNNAVLRDVIAAVNAGKDVLKVYLYPEWNLISSPFVGWSPWTVLEAEHISGLYQYVGGTYQALTRPAVLEPGVGYFLALSGNEPMPVIMSGLVPSIATIPASAGWTLFGPIADTPTDAMEFFTGEPMAWHAPTQQYVPAGDMLRRGLGYWGYARGAAELEQLTLTEMMFDHHAGSVTLQFTGFMGGTLLVRMYDITRDRFVLERGFHDLAADTQKLTITAKDGFQMQLETRYSVEICGARDGLRGPWARESFFSGDGQTVEARPFENADIRAAVFDWETHTFSNLAIGTHRIEYRAAVLMDDGTVVAQESKRVDSVEVPLDLSGLGLQAGQTVYIMARIIDSETGYPRSDWRTFERVWE